MTPEKQHSMDVHRALVRDGEFMSARRLLRAINNGVVQITISYSDTDWTLGRYLNGNRFKYVNIQ